MLKPRKPANRGRNPPGVNGRPKADPSLVARAVELVRDEGLTCEEAGEQVGVELGTRLGGNTVRRAVKAKEGAGVALEVVEPAEASLELPGEVTASIVSIADPEKARAVRRLVAGMGGTWDGEAVESLATTWGCALADVQALVIEASIQAGRCALPPELAREEALAVLRWVRDEAKNAADFRSVTAATSEILKVQLAAAERDGETLTRAQFVALAREMIEAAAPWPEARAAVLAVISRPD